MTSSGLGRVPLLLMLACAGAQSTAGSGLLASALALGLHTHEHAHSAFLVREGGHLHLVLAHGEGTDHGHEAVSHHEELSGSLSESDHVFHVTGDDATTSASRRPGLALAPALVTPIVSTFSSARSMFRPAPEPRARGTDLLRPVVLRL